MSIVLVRIDDRLIHGQIIVEWAPFVHASAIVIAEDEIGRNRFRGDFIEAMKIAVPPGIHVEAYGVSEVVHKFLNNELPSGNVILLFSKLDDFKKSLALGFKTGEVNLGCIHTGEIAILNNITIRREEIYYIEEIRRSGIHLDLRAIPRSKQVDVNSLSIYRKHLK